MRSTLECMPCFLRQTLEAARMATEDPALQERILREVMKLTAEMDLSVTPPAMGRRVHQIVRELAETPDPYQQVKQRYNRMALRRLPELKAKVESASNPLKAAVQLAIAGNIIDFGVDGELTDQKVEETIERALHQDIDGPTLRQLEAEIQKARSILYLGDNAGEIVFDRLLLEQMPAEKVVFAVKGSPIINDATLDDAEQAGLTNLVRVIENGSNAPGTIVEECSPAFQELFESADLMIAKGQGNFETLNESPANLFFLFQAKCRVVSRHLKKPIGSFILCRSVCLNRVETKV